MKICNKCKNKKILSEYYRNKKSKDGHSFYCKVCCSMDGKKYRKSRRDWNKNNKDIVNRSTLEYRNRNPEKKKASNLLGVAIANGKIKRQPCCVCGDMNSHGHHEDYSKPLEVTWLCAIHHKQIHANTNTMKLSPEWIELKNIKYKNVAGSLNFKLSSVLKHPSIAKEISLAGKKVRDKAIEASYEAMAITDRVEAHSYICNEITNQPKKK